MTTITPLSILALTFLGCASLRAQMVDFMSEGPIQNASDIATNGSYVDALQTHGSYSDQSTLVPVSVTNPTTGVATEFNIYTVFKGVGNPASLVYGDGTFSITADDDNGGDGSGSDATPYQKVLDHVTYTGSVGTVTMRGLTPGDQYQVQVWNAAGFRPTTFASGTSSIDTNGQYAIGTFTAPAAAVGSLTSSEFFTYMPSGNNNAGEINALSLRDTSVPEPSTYALMLGAVGLFCAGRAARNRSLSF